VTSIFLERIVDGLYQGLSRELPDSVPILGVLFVMTSLYAWFWSYSQSHRVAWVMDMGWFLFIAWLIILPYCIIRAEGRPGWARVGLFCLTYLGAFVTGWATLLWTQLVFR
jgi:hypothetical protein